MTSEQFGKQEWVSLFRDIGLDEAQMEAWHRAFETKHPTRHQTFLEWLGIPADEIREIRAL